MISSTVQRLLQNFYDEDLWSVLNAQGISELKHHEWLTDTQDLSLMAMTNGLGQDSPAVDYVIASTCIDHSEADPRKLSAAVVADLIHGAEIARALSVPLISFICLGEEIRLVPGGNELVEQWMEVAKQVAEVFENLQLPLGSKLFNTNEESVWEILSETVNADREQVSDVQLNGLYHLTDGSLFPLGSPYRYYYEYYRYNIAHYRRSVFEKLLKKPVRGVLVVENTQQVKAITLARQLNAGWPTEQLVTLPAPNRTGDERATRARGNERLLLDELNRLRDRSEEISFPDMSPDSLHFWKSTYRLWNKHALIGMNISRGVYEADDEIES